MSNFLTHVTINNFKSIKQCVIPDCRRFNIFIGRPNSGRSNILEALSVFSIPYLRENISKNLSNLIRLENEAELFNNGNFKQPVVIESNRGRALINFDRDEGLFVNINTSEVSADFLFDNKLNLRSKGNVVDKLAIKKYKFSKQLPFQKKLYRRHLIPPYGDNLFSVLEQNVTLKNEIAQIFREYNLAFALDKSNRSLEIMKPGKKESFLIPYQSISETLKRIIFFKTAIAGNDDSVLLFEEPEAHLFPPSISQITQAMMHKTDNNISSLLIVLLY